MSIDSLDILPADILPIHVYRHLAYKQDARRQLVCIKVVLDVGI
jgi:hypothetical protein